MRCRRPSYGMLWVGCGMVFCVKQKTPYELRISDWTSDVCSSDLIAAANIGDRRVREDWRALFHLADEHRNRDRPGIPERPEDEIGRASCRERVCRYV